MTTMDGARARRGVVPMPPAPLAMTTAMATTMAMPAMAATVPTVPSDIRHAAAVPNAIPAASDYGLLTVVASTGDVDRHGDVIAPDGWRLDAYRRNPVVLWAHDYRRPAIGRAAAVWREGDALLAQLEFAPTEFAGEVAALYRQGYQQGVSVGFRPIRFEERRDARSGAFLGIRFLEQELLEISAAPVPANGRALRRRAAGAPLSAAMPASATAVIDADRDRDMDTDSHSHSPAASVIALLRELRA